MYNYQVSLTVFGFKKLFNVICTLLIPFRKTRYSGKSICFSLREHFSSVLFSHSFMYNSLWPHGMQHAKLPSKLISIELVMPSNHFILCRPLLLPPSIFPGIRVFPNESVLRIRWPKYWSFSFRVSPFNEYKGLISFRMDWLDHLYVQGTLKSLFQHHSSKASILWCSAFFIVQLSYPYTTTRKTIALAGWTFVGK